jgi:hypothetical protein
MRWLLACLRTPFRKSIIESSFPFRTVRYASDFGWSPRGWSHCSRANSGIGRFAVCSLGHSLRSSVSHQDITTANGCNGNDTNVLNTRQIESPHGAGAMRFSRKEGRSTLLMSATSASRKALVSREGLAEETRRLQSKLLLVLEWAHRSQRAELMAKHRHSITTKRMICDPRSCILSSRFFTRLSSFFISSSESLRGTGRRARQFDYSGRRLRLSIAFPRFIVETSHLLMFCFRWPISPRRAAA